MRSPLWIPDTIVKVTVPQSYHVETENGIEVRRHADQLRPRSLETPKQPTQIFDNDFYFPTRTPLRTDTTDQPSPTSPTSTVPLRRSNQRKTTTRTVQPIHFILKGEECEISMYLVTIIIIHSVTYKYSYIYAYKCACFFNNNQLVCWLVARLNG